MEDKHHIFVDWPQYSAFRSNAAKALQLAMETRIKAGNFDPEKLAPLLKYAESFYADSENLWTLHISQYFFGHVPSFNAHCSSQVFPSPLIQERFLKNIHDNWHKHSKWLAGRIWGEHAQSKAIYLNCGYHKR